MLRKTILAATACACIAGAAITAWTEALARDLYLPNSGRAEKNYVQVSTKGTPWFKAVAKCTPYFAHKDCYPPK
jgi:hypothetical protein